MLGKVYTMFYLLVMSVWRSGRISLVCSNYGMNKGEAEAVTSPKQHRLPPTPTELEYQN